MTDKNTLQANYKTLPVVFSTIVFVAFASWVYFAPVTRGRMANVLRNEDGLTILGTTVFVIALVMALLLVTYAVRALAGLPALKSDGKTIKTYVFPFRSIPILSIDRIIIGSNDVELYDKRNRKRKINIRPINDAEVFFEEIKATIT
jgi:hypothetical protein